MLQSHSACRVKAGVALVVATLVAATLHPVEAQELSGQPIRLIVGGRPTAQPTRWRASWRKR